ncbi:hypothetical protein [Marinicella litoralis]|uniref:Uncharacterized protein n=1 Tax=Marinicella litoralis TaxID=644220 RepID=A0A4R6XM37_9GAMM|nr:hypothetical protein [Marinicella litoralis]TDR20646.1 hypothetical protein C8D91_1621 [Marinicella litoralis]
MSQIVTIERHITAAELSKALQQVEGLSLGEEYSWGITIDCSFDSNSLLTFSNGHLTVTSPSDELFLKCEVLAKLLGAEVILEDEVPSVQLADASQQGVEIVLLWPVLFVVLVLLLIWKW